MVAIAVLSLIMSIAAVLMSVITLYYAHLSPFELNVTNEHPRFIAYEVTSEMRDNPNDYSWWLPIFTTGITFHNSGQRAGKVEDVRISVDMEDESSTQIFQSEFIVDLNTFEKHHQNRPEWREKAIVRNWYPFILRGNDEKSPHIVFQHWRWIDKKTGKMDIALEVKASDTNRWETVSEYELVLTDEHHYKKGIIANPA